jgi:sugar/nucleoside kinase (ribokinase family)
LDVLKKLPRPPLVACDTMNFWINGKRDALWRVLEQVDILIINDGEARALGEDSNLVKVAKKVLARGPKHLIIKRGEYGVLMFNEKQVFGAPAFPLEDVRDPTGAGDTFAGGFLGYLTATGDRSLEAFKQAIIFGSVMASFTVEAFSLDRLRILDYKEVQARFRAFKQLTHFEDIS